MRETVEGKWSAELGEEVELREWADFNELDVYLNGQFAVTVVTLDQAEQWLERYSMVRDFGLGQTRL